MKKKLWRKFFGMLGFGVFNFGILSCLDAQESCIHDLSLKSSFQEDREKGHHPNACSITFNYEAVIGLLLAETNTSLIYLNFTSFVTTPDGKVHFGETITTSLASVILSGTSGTLTLAPITIKHPHKGNYVLGYFFSLAPSSAPFTITPIITLTGICSGLVGHTPQYAPIPALVFGSAIPNTNSAVVTASVNFEVAYPFF